MRAAETLFDVSRITITYGLSHPSLPSPDELTHIEVPIGTSGGVFVPANTPGASITTLPLSSLPAGARFSLPAIVAVMEGVVGELNRRDLQVVFVRPDSRQINLAESTDLRAADDRSLHLIVWVGQIAEVRTIAKGERFLPDHSINNPAHARIRAESPIQPGQGEAAGGLFRRTLVDDYVSGLSTHPTRRVEASLASAGEPGKVVLDYLVNEVRPWQIFAQSSNTGSKAIGVWRTRLGFQHTQLTSRDDILNLDVVSSGKWETRAGLVSYSLPLKRPDVLKLRVFGSAGDFKIDDLGFQQARFTGDNWQAGTELAYRIRMPKTYTLVAQTGVSYNHYNVDSSVANTAAAGGRSGFLIPFVGARLTRVTERLGAALALRLEHSVDGVPNESPTNGIRSLGRVDPATSWTVIKGGLSAASRLDSLFNPTRRAETAPPSGDLAHEISLSLRGQYVLSRDRLVPQEQDLIGGAYSVRGYPDSILSADDSLVTSAEYAFHPGRIFQMPRIWGSEVGVLFRAFTDYGRAWVTPPAGTGGGTRGTEQDRSLWSVGAGTELSFRKQISLRCDVGYVLREIRDSFTVLAEKGDVRAHFIGSITW
jgi:hemolysin activation/secretion protein